MEQDVIKYTFLILICVIFVCSIFIFIAPSTIYKIFDDYKNKKQKAREDKLYAFNKERAKNKSISDRYEVRQTTHHESISNNIAFNSILISDSLNSGCNSVSVSDSSPSYSDSSSSSSSCSDSSY